MNEDEKAKLLATIKELREVQRAHGSVIELLLLALCGSGTAHLRAMAQALRQQAGMPVPVGTSRLLQQWADRLEQTARLSEGDRTP